MESFRKIGLVVWPHGNLQTDRHTDTHTHTYTHTHSMVRHFSRYDYNTFSLLKRLNVKRGVIERKGDKVSKKEKK